MVTDLRARGKNHCASHAALSDQGQPPPYILHSAYYLKVRGARPKAIGMVVYLGAHGKHHCARHAALKEQHEDLQRAQGRRDTRSIYLTPYKLHGSKFKPRCIQVKV